jgi:heat shock protein HslJ
MRFLPLVLLTALAGCATAALGPNIAGRELHALDVNGVPVTGPRPLTLRLDDGRATGNAGCNTFSAPYEASAERIEFGAVVSTRMACEPAIMEQEARFLSILDAATSFSRYGNGSLSVIAPDGRAIRFRPAP